MSCGWSAKNGESLSFFYMLSKDFYPFSCFRLHCPRILRSLRLHCNGSWESPLFLDIASPCGSNSRGARVLQPRWVFFSPLLPPLLRSLFCSGRRFSSYSE